MEKISKNDKENFVTIVTVGRPPKCGLSLPDDADDSDYVTVLTIGDDQIPTNETIEELLVYRLPGERLGFGLKFEGGVKANEFVKRLFIQSCAPNSPASRVQSSWGKLTEGDEVLEIDNTAVNTMTRIDCVRCLKDSNVVIKLLVKHHREKESHEGKSRSLEILPQVISAEKKRTPPPPPPVPPRKIPKKFHKNGNREGDVLPVAIRHNQDNKKLKSSTNSGRPAYSPDISRREKRISDGDIGPPDAEVYVDLFSQESAQSLSESDDTGSSISTVVDRFASFPTTTTSSLAGSLPSTPTSIQKHLDVSNLFNSFDDEDLNRTSHTQNFRVYHTLELNQKNDTERLFNPNININEDGMPLQPPSCFQDAPLSYGNEDMRMIHSIDVIDSSELEMSNSSQKQLKKPPVPPRSKTNDCKEIHDENMNVSNLPRLVDFVPKCSNKENIDVELVKDFLSSERYINNLNDYQIDECENIYSVNDEYRSKWNLFPQLATIGEVEEEIHSDSRCPINATTPIVIVENCDVKENLLSGDRNGTKDFNGNMETLPSDSRQPPDGHEFPDYIEIESKTSDYFSGGNFTLNHSNINDTKMESNFKNYNKLVNSTKENFNQDSNVMLQNKTLNKVNSVSDCDISSIDYINDVTNDNEISSRRNSLEINLHSRSQSLVDMSTISKKNERWNQLVEQRRKGLSKLKGLIIPEYVPENVPPPINIPEIISHTTSLVPDLKYTLDVNNISFNSEIEAVTLPLSVPPWTSNTSNLPKYSPAFKRKNLEIYLPYSKLKEEETKQYKQNLTTCSKQFSEDLRLENLSDAPKSLESLISPTRSDYSFDYITNSFKGKLDKQEENLLDYKENYHGKSLKDITKSEDESDNDSAVSSSQSSYISRCSPPPSPSRSCEMLDYVSKSEPDKCLSNSSRLLKPASVEAINRKNILASAKCRSGRDFKVGSPVIQRKNEEHEAKLPYSIAFTDKPIEQVDSNHLKSNKDKQIEKVISKGPSIGLKKVVKQLESETSFKNNGKISNLSCLKSVPGSLRDNPKEISKLKNNYKISSPRLLNSNVKAISVTDLRKTFEKSDQFPIQKPPYNQIKDLKEGAGKMVPSKGEQNFKDDNRKGESCVIKEKGKCFRTSEENIGNSRRKIILRPKYVGGSIGITLAGGIDYETKEITVHKIRYGSVAYHDGQLKKGIRIISINGKKTCNLTHSEAVDILKELVDEFVFIIEDGPFLKEELAQESKACSDQSTTIQVEKNATHIIAITKEGAGLGFSIEGGKESPQGDLPLCIKKIFQGFTGSDVVRILGGAADKSGQLAIGDELLALNEIDVTRLTKIQVWSLMKKLPNGNVTIRIYR